MRSKLLAAGVFAATVVALPSCALLSNSVPRDELNASGTRLATTLQVGTPIDECRRVLLAEGYEEKEDLRFYRLVEDEWYGKRYYVIELEAEESLLKSFVGDDAYLGL